MKLKRCMILLLFSILFLSACGRETADIAGDGTGQEAKEQQEVVYIPEWTQFAPDLVGAGSLYGELLVNDNLYYSYTAMEDERIVSYIGCKNLLSQDDAVAMKQGEGFIAALFEDQEDTVWCIRQSLGGEGEEEKWWLEKSVFSEGEPVQIDVSGEFEEMEILQDIVMDENGYLYVLGGDIGSICLKVLDQEGVCVRTVEGMSNAYSLDVLPEKGVLLDGYGCSARLFSLQAQEPENIEEISSRNKLKLAVQEDGDILFIQGFSLMRYKAETRETQEIANLSESNVVIDQVQDINILSDGRICLLVKDWSKGGILDLVCLKAVRPDEVPEKKVLILGTMMSETSLNAAVAEFNKKSTEYRIEIKEYITDDWSAALQQMKQEFAAGTGVDLLDLRYLGAEVQIYLEKGILEDLTPYLENSELVNREDFLPNLLESYTEGGILYTIPDAFSVHTLVGRSGEVGEEPGWTREEFMRYALSLPEDVMLMPYQSKHMMLYYLLGSRAEPFVDQESGISYLDSEDFRQYMEFANHYSLNGADIAYDQIPRLLNEGQLRLDEVTIAEMMDLQKHYGYFGEPVTYIGYPTVDGSCGTYFVGSGKMFGINSASSEKDAAWDFISMQLTAYAQQQAIDSGYGMTYGFPSRKDALELYFEKSMEANYIYDNNGEILLDEKGEPMQSPKLTVTMPAEGGGTTRTEYYASTEEEVEMMKNLISSIMESDASERKIPDMILEEADFYFSGQKSLDETIAVMQSRVQLYLDEKK